MPPQTAPPTQPGDTASAVEVARVRRAALLAAIGRLERALAKPAHDQVWPVRVRISVNNLAAAFADHVTATEGPSGIYTEIRRTAPRLEFAVTRLEHEHADIRAAIAALAKLSEDLGDRRAADRTKRDGARVERIRDEGTDLLGRLVRHRQRGADLVFEAYEQDIGGCD